MLFRDRLWISLLILSDFKRINFYTPSNYQKTISFRWFKGEYKLINSLNVRGEIWRRCLIQNRRNIGQDESKLTYCHFQEIWLLGFSYHWHEVKQLGLLKILYISVKEFKNGHSICWRQPLKNLKWYGLLKSSLFQFMM